MFEACPWWSRYSVVAKWAGHVTCFLWWYHFWTSCGLKRRTLQLHYHFTVGNMNNFWRITKSEFFTHFGTKKVFFLKFFRHFWWFFQILAPNCHRILILRAQNGAKIGHFAHCVVYKHFHSSFELVCIDWKYMRWYKLSKRLFVLVRDVHSRGIVKWVSWKNTSLQFFNAGIVSRPPGFGSEETPDLFIGQPEC